MNVSALFWPLLDRSGAQNVFKYVILRTRALQMLWDRHTVNRQSGCEPGHTRWYAPMDTRAAGCSQIIRYRQNYIPVTSCISFFTFSVFPFHCAKHTHAILTVSSSTHVTSWTLQRPTLSTFCGSDLQKDNLFLCWPRRQNGSVDLFVHSLKFGTKWGEVKASHSDRFVRNETSHGKIRIGVSIWMLCRT